jgi:hypothetical protein
MNEGGMAHAGIIIRSTPTPPSGESMYIQGSAYCIQYYSIITNREGGEAATQTGATTEV